VRLTQLPASESSIDPAFVTENLQGSLVTSLTDLILQATSLEDAHLETLKRRNAGVSAAASSINVTKDQDLFIDYNIRPFSAPADWGFEPCNVHYDTVGAVDSFGG
jgi:hypothetical protein